MGLCLPSRVEAPIMRLETTCNFIIIFPGTSLVPPHLLRCVTVSQITISILIRLWYKDKPTCYTRGAVCVFFTLNRSSTRRHPAHPVSVLILHPRKISSVVTSYDTEIMHRNAFDNAMSCPSTGYDRHNIHTSATEIHWKREYEINKNKIIIRKHEKTKIKIKQK